MQWIMIRRQIFFYTIDVSKRVDYVRIRLNQLFWSVNLIHCYNAQLYLKITAKKECNSFCHFGFLLVKDFPLKQKKWLWHTLSCYSNVLNAIITRVETICKIFSNLQRNVIISCVKKELRTVIVEIIIIVWYGYSGVERHILIDDN